MTQARRYTSEELLRILIGFDTTSCYSNLEMIHWIRDYLAEYGVSSILVHDENEEKANLFATIGRDAGSVEGGVALSGHTDVVPVDGQNWSSDPFQLERRGDKYYGRGTCDMKGFIAVALAKLGDMTAQNLVTPLHFAFSYDEETGCYGAPKMIARFGKDIVCPQVVIVGEPSDMQVISAHKGASHFVTEVRGLSRHTSQPHLGVNAIFYGAQLVEKLRQLSLAVAERGASNAHGKGFEPPYSSIQIGVMHGGTANNIIPELCRFFWEIRDIAGDDTDEILRPFYDLQSRLDSEMRSIDSSCGVSTHVDSVPVFSEDLDSKAERLVRSLTGDNEVRYVSYSTETGQFQEAGCSAVICGPGSIDQAHRPDEFLAVAQLEKCEIFIDKLIAYCRQHRL